MHCAAVRVHGDVAVERLKCVQHGVPLPKLVLFRKKFLRGKGREERVFQLLSLLLAALVGYGAARFASRLAGGLAFAAAAGFWRSGARQGFWIV